MEDLCIIFIILVIIAILGTDVVATAVMTMVALNLLSLTSIKKSKKKSKKSTFISGFEPNWQDNDNSADNMLTSSMLYRGNRDKIAQDNRSAWSKSDWGALYNDELEGNREWWSNTAVESTDPYANRYR